LKRSFLFKLLTLILITVSLSLLCSFAVGCQSGDGREFIEDGSVTVGGEDVGTKDGQTVFYSADDLHVALSAIEDTLDSNAYVYENGLKVNVDVDCSKVTFGSAGEYEITYRYGQDFVVKTLYVYGLPTLSGENAVSVDFSNAPTGIFSGLTATDYFGGSLDVQVIDANGMIDLDGSFNVGTFTVKMIAIDKAGQVVEFLRTVTVNEERNPSISGSYSFDVNEESFSFVLEDEDSVNFVGVSFNGTGVPAQMLSVSDNTYTIAKEFFYQYILSENLVSDLKNGDDYVMSILTSKGKTKVDFTLFDKQDIVYDLSPIETFAKEYYACFAEIKVPKIVLINAYQNVKPTYAFVQGTNRIEITDGTVNFPTDGTWQMEIDLRGKKVYTDVQTYYDLGYKNGTVYSEQNPFKNNLPSGYVLSEIVVNDNANGSKIIYCDDQNELGAFINQVNALNTGRVYDLTVKATKDGKMLTQKTNFSVVKSGVSILGDNADALNMSVSNDEFTCLDYTQKLVGGRRGTYYWGGKKATAYSDKSKITFSEGVRAQMKKDYYISFDVYYTKEVVMIINYGSGYSYYTWGPATIYSSTTEHKEQEPNGSPHSSDSVYCGDIIKFFDASGRQIVRDKNGYDPMRNYRNQWITVQFKIEADSIPDTAGFHIYTEASSLDKQEVYISNFKVSAVAPMEDQTINPIIKEEWEVDFEDIWN
jgi:hypothetical protein